VSLQTGWEGEDFVGFLSSEGVVGVSTTSQRKAVSGKVWVESRAGGRGMEVRRAGLGALLPLT